MIGVAKTKNESSDRLIRRFNKKIQQSRMVQMVRDKRYYARKKNKRKIRKAALMREYYRRLKEQMKFYG